MAKGFRGAATFVALYCCAGCDGRPAAAAEDRGPMLAADVASIGATTFAWLSGDAEIALVTSGSQLVAVRVADGTRRQLDPARASYHSDLARSRDGTALYFVAEDLSGPQPRYTLREAFTGKQAPVGDVMNGMLAVSADAHRVLYSRANGASVLDVSGTVFPLPPPCPGWPLRPAFSPSSDQLLCTGEHAAFVQVTDGSTQTLPDTDPTLWRAIRWDASGPQAVGFGFSVAPHELVQLLDVATAKARVLYETDDGLLDLANAAISNDGRRVAFWETRCVHSESFLSCQQTEARLKVVDTSTGRAATVASGAAGPGPILFSDDGARIAYLFQAGWGELHVRPVP